jgi:hypothetical protein
MSLATGCFSGVAVIRRPSFGAGSHSRALFQLKGTSPPDKELGILFLVVPAVVLISYLNIKVTKFCDNCGARLYNHTWFAPMRSCSKCGAELDAAKTTHGDSLLE